MTSTACADRFGSGFESLCERLTQQTGSLEGERDWPGEQFTWLADAGVLGWVIPAEFGGTEISAEDLTLGYRCLAASCLATTFVLTQRNGACQRIAGSEQDAIKAELLPALCAGETFATVGVSHLTTSGQHLRTPAVEVSRTDNGFLFNGVIPWVTGAKFADQIITGGTCGDGRQVLAVIPTAAEGVSVEQPPRLLALNASQTGAVRLENVEIDRRFLLAGPDENVMKLGKGGGAGSLTTSALAVGTAEGVLRRLKVEADRRADLVEIYEPLTAECLAIFDDMMLAVQSDAAANDAPPSAESIRRRANSLVLRAAQAYLAASKGAGYVTGHPAERAVREAMFFLVWSCPQPVLHAAMREFACVLES